MPGDFGESSKTGPKASACSITVGKKLLTQNLEKERILGHFAFLADGDALIAALVGGPFNVTDEQRAVWKDLLPVVVRQA